MLVTTWRLWPTADIIAGYWYSNASKSNHWSNTWFKRWIGRKISELRINLGSENCTPLEVSEYFLEIGNGIGYDAGQELIHKNGPKSKRRCLRPVFSCDRPRVFESISIPAVSRGLHKKLKRVVPYWRPSGYYTLSRETSKSLGDSLDFFMNLKSRRINSWGAVIFKTSFFWSF